MSALAAGESSLADRVRLGAVAASSLAQARTGHVLPVHSSLAGLFPSGGLRRGSLVVVHGSTSLLIALLAEASRAGSWCAVVGMADFGVAAAAEAGIVPDRLALVPWPQGEPGVDGRAPQGSSGSGATEVIAALIDGLDVVAVGDTAISPADRSRLLARARQRGSVLVSCGARSPWSGADVELSCGDSSWRGLGAGHGHLQGRRVTVRTRGRGASARPRKAHLLLPAPGGGVASGEPVVPVSPLVRPMVTSTPDRAWAG